MAELICAIATAMAPSGVGIIRLSGENAVAVTEKVFRPESGKVLSAHPKKQMVYGGIFDEKDRLLDRGLAFYSLAPHSYTGEETAEIQCHGSPVVLGMILEALFAKGARQALPGEFTKRAFLNGKLDLTQAEAVIDLIDAETPAAAQCAASQLEGALSRRVDEIYSILVDVMAHFYAVLDYPDEDIDPFRKETIEKALEESTQKLSSLVASYQRGRQITYGVPAVIVGRPNVGKSSLLNALAGYERAIVTELAGTTRDTIEERVTVAGVLLRLVDTAGIRETGDVVERMGVARSRGAVAEASLAVLVLDQGAKLEEEDKEAIALAQTAPNCICILNKSDLPSGENWEDMLSGFSYVCKVSAHTGSGIEDFEKAVKSLYPFGGDTMGGETFLTNARQFEAAQRALDCLERSWEGLRDEMPPDLLLTDVEEALHALGDILGRTLGEDITSRIFERFCVGK